MREIVMVRYYHATDIKNWKKISKEGLKPKRSEIGEPTATFMWNKQDITEQFCEEFVKLWGAKKCSIIQIDLPKDFPLQKRRCIVGLPGYTRRCEYFTTKKIPQEYLTLRKVR